MTERSDASPFADDPLRLRLFDGPLQEAEATSQSQVAADRTSDLLESEESFEGELPDDLLALAERLASEAHGLASTYPAGSPDRLPIGEGEAIAIAPPSDVASRPAEAVEERSASSMPARRTFGIGTAAAIGFAAIVGATIYSASTSGTRDAVAEMEVRGTDASSTANGPGDRETLESVAGLPVRMVSLSLANERDYRRLESLLRDRSEPEREAMFDLLGEKDSGEETAVRIAF